MSLKAEIKIHILSINLNESTMEKIIKLGMSTKQTNKKNTQGKCNKTAAKDNFRVVVTTSTRSVHVQD